MKHPAILHRATFGRLKVEVWRDPAALGRAAARACTAGLRAVIADRGAARAVFAGTHSQRDFFAALAGPRTRRTVDWSKVTTFQLQEFVGLSAGASPGCGHYLEAQLLSRVKPGRFHRLEADLPDLAAACARYDALLGEEPIDLICLGIGENGHLAFNDPAVADFRDPAGVKPVELDATCRQQQVNDGGFSELGAVPRHALTLTLPAIRRARRLSIFVTGARRAPATRAALHDAITTACPASMLRLHPQATLYLDRPAASLAFAAADLSLPGRGQLP